MKRILVALALVTGCSDRSAPTLANGYLLAAIDGKSFPAVPIGWSAGRAIEAASLDFGQRQRLNDGDQGTVTYAVTVAGQSAATEHQFRVSAGILHIDLCPIGRVYRDPHGVRRSDRVGAAEPDVFDRRDGNGEFGLPVRGPPDQLTGVLDPAEHGR